MRDQLHSGMSYMAMGLENDTHVSNKKLIQNIKTKLAAAYGTQPWKLGLIPNKHGKWGLMAKKRVGWTGVEIINRRNTG